MKPIKDLTPVERARVFARNPTLAAVVQQKAEPEIPLNMDGTPQSAEHRVDWPRIARDGRYFDEIRASGLWQEGLAARAEREKAEREAEQRAKRDEELAELLAGMDREDAERQRAEDDRERVRSQGIFPPPPKEITK
jgi:hypothetical protein